MEDQMCPLCTEALDETDLLGQFCGCNFKICLFCQQRIVEEAAAQGIPPACPNCRSVYDKERVQKQQHDPSLCALETLLLPSRVRPNRSFVVPFPSAA